VKASEGRADLPENIRQEVESRPDKAVLFEIISSLQADGVVITDDVYTAIVKTLQLSQEIIDN